MSILSSQETAKYLSSLKQGDTVYVRTRTGMQKKTVDRTTNTQIVCGHSRFRKADGRLVGGDSYTHKTIVLPTPEIIEKANQSEINRWTEIDLPRALSGMSFDQKVQLRAFVSTLAAQNDSANTATNPAQ